MDSAPSLLSNVSQESSSKMISENSMCPLSSCMPESFALGACPVARSGVAWPVWKKFGGFCRRHELQGCVIPFRNLRCENIPMSKDGFPCPLASVCWLPADASCRTVPYMQKKMGK